MNTSFLFILGLDKFKSIEQIDLRSVDRVQTLTLTGLQPATHLPFDIHLTPISMYSAWFCLHLRYNIFT